MSLLRKVYTTTEIKTSPYDKISYRQKGCEIAGAIFRGCANNAFTKQTLGSIPSKYETVLHPLREKRKGFGINAMRFSTEYNDNPGPGSYIDCEMLATVKLNSDSFSQKGYGNGFISQTKRFKIENYHPYQTPGPGKYEEKSQILKTDMSSNPNVPKLTRQFKSTTVLNKKKEPLKNPGPGAYEYSKVLANEVNIISSFKSTAQRFNQKSHDIPGPDHYLTDLEGVKRQLKESSSMSNFKQPTGSKRVKVNLYDPFSNPSAETNIPGPGGYDIAHFSIQHEIDEKKKVGKSSNMFCLPLKPQKHPKNLPGPGQYKVEETIGFGKTSQQVGHSSDFKSASKRTNSHLSKNPGPAYYPAKPQISVQTHNANPTTKWI
jgi:hypothetical protein